MDVDVDVDVDVEQFSNVGLLVGLHAPDNRATYTYSVEQMNNLVLLTTIVYYWDMDDSSSSRGLYNSIVH